MNITDLLWSVQFGLLYVNVLYSAVHVPKRVHQSSVYIQYTPTVSVCFHYSRPTQIVDRHLSTKENVSATSHHRYVFVEVIKNIIKSGFFKMRCFRFGSVRLGDGTLDIGLHVATFKIYIPSRGIDARAYGADDGKDRLCIFYNVYLYSGPIFDHYNSKNAFLQCNDILPGL